MSKEERDPVAERVRDGFVDYPGDIADDTPEPKYLSDATGAQKARVAAALEQKRAQRETVATGAEKPEADEEDKADGK